ncbi:MAG: lipid-A-disaccharide synthase [Planctomycetes bacterium RBG_16_64_10]|nr:MAG: lipid-A-disaccharide synthase [Planctomycetes bacterium RBG_16_64_10]
MRIFFSVGEPSGDLHGGNLIRELKRRDPQLECVGYGGPKMAQAGCQIHEDLTRLAVMWVWHAVLHLAKFLRLIWRAGRYFRTARPDAVVLIDYPGFNWWIARLAARNRIPVFYYGPPQMWAWAGWRVGKMRRLVDHVLCKLPFEETWYRQRGCHTCYVGHPYFDELERQQLDANFLARRATQRPMVTILPGSRTQEVTHNLRWLLKAAAIVQQRVPNVQFAIAAFRSHHAEMAAKMVKTTGLPIDVFVGRTGELIHLADCCMACSGSVSLELLYHAKPAVILYWISRLAYFVQGFFRKVKYITLVNLLASDELYPADLRPYDPRQADADKVLMPEYLTCADKSAEIAGHVVEWLTDRARWDARVAALQALRARMCLSGASQRAAEYILQQLAGRAAARAVGPPHFRAVRVKYPA